MPTKALYYEDPSLDNCSALVLSSEEGGRLLELDQSPFYPEGGGQPCDLGFIGGLALQSVFETGGRVFHRLKDASCFGPGDSVTLILDRSRRRDHSEQHSAQHLLSGILWERCRIQTLSFHLGPQQATIDVAATDIDQAALRSVEEEANRLISRGIPFVIHRSPPEDLESLPLRKPPPSGAGVVRIIEIEGLDCSPCCGTHVMDARHLRLVKILGVEHYKGNVRLSFVAGGRAVELFCRVYDSARAAGRILSAPAEALEPEALRLAARVKELSTASRRLLRALVTAEIERQSPTQGARGGFIFDIPGPGSEAIDEGVRGLLERKVGGLVVARDALSVALVAAPLGKVGEKPRFRARELGGRGGGPASSFRAIFPDSQSLETFLREAPSFFPHA